jgi:diaminohydroxyphosphoribosylaminopyrimidine deaminase/5-amino-6-(5-phosphoribosylamino)uracil reductase
VNIHEKYIKRCIELAKKGLGTTYPNPLVGSVIVYNNKIIGEGWHYQAGKPHAEVNAVNSVKNKDLISEATIYVSLEPCSHFGKTPPCSDLIIKCGIKNVVIGTVDPFSKVAGRGINKLREAGCNVTVGVLEERCKELNKRFFTFHLKKRPYIILKWAASADGFLSPYQSVGGEEAAKQVWITNKLSKQLVHKWRSEEQAILAGTHTVLIDNPSLTTREWHGKSPLRITLDSDLKIPNGFNIFNEEAATLIFTDHKILSTVKNSSLFQNISFDENVYDSMLKTLYEKNIQSIIIEGGAFTLQGFIEKNLWDEARVFIGQKVFNSGIPAPRITGDLIKKTTLITDQLYIWKNQV